MIRQALSGMIHLYQSPACKGTNTPKDRSLPKLNEILYEKNIIIIGQYVRQCVVEESKNFNCYPFLGRQDLEVANSKEIEKTYQLKKQNSIKLFAYTNVERSEHELEIAKETNYLVENLPMLETDKKLIHIYRPY